MLVANLKKELELEVWERLDGVTDPELDEPITDMGFVEAVEVTDARKVRVAFRLPTYWCSPNFAFLMAFGIRREVMALPWVAEAEVLLNDHCFGDKVNEGVNSGRAFTEIFAEYCDGARLDEALGPDLDVLPAGDTIPRNEIWAVSLPYLNFRWGPPFLIFLEITGDILINTPPLKDPKSGEFAYSIYLADFGSSNFASSIYFRILSVQKLPVFIRIL